MPLPRWLPALSASFAFSLLPIQAASHLAALGQSAEPQSPQLIPRTPEERARSYQNLHRIVLYVQVNDASGKPPAELRQIDFTIFEDHQVRKIASFRPIREGLAADPLNVIVVVDTVNNSSGKVAQFRKEIEKYLSDGDGLLANPMSIALLSDKGIRLGTPSLDRVALLKELDELAGDVHSIACSDTLHALECNVPALPDGSSPPCDPNPRLECLNHQFNASIAALTSLAQEQVNKPGRIILVWLGSGWPLLNDYGFVPDTPDVKGSFFRNLVAVSSALREAQITLEVVSSSRAPIVSPRDIRDSFFFNGISDENHASAASLAPQALAYQSGGMVLTNNKDIASAIARCVADAKSYYVLAFDSPPATRYGEYHSLEVRVDRPELKVRTRTLYYAEQ